MRCAALSSYSQTASEKTGWWKLRASSCVKSNVAIGANDLLR